MATIQEQIAQIESAIATQEALRATIGDTVADITINALRHQLNSLNATLREKETVAGRTPTPLAPEQLLERLQSYLPKELARKMQAGGQIESERKLVTVLFADISGFTALSERFDPEEVAIFINEALKELAEAVYQYEGHIDKFIGDAIMAVFGAPIAHENDAERALRAAIEMRERMSGFNRRWADRLGQELELHIGINTGPVIAGNVGSDQRLSYTVMGDTVNLASRLEGVAKPGQILVSRDTYRQTHESFNFVALEPVMVKGKREPISVFELQKARALPGKSRGVSGVSAELVGRETELDKLRQVGRQLLNRQGSIVSIVGEAGLGKSRLTSEWRYEMHKNVRWLEGRAFSHTTTLSYGPFLDLFRRYAEIREEDSKAQARIRLHETLNHLFPDTPEAEALFASMLGMRLSLEEMQILQGLTAENLRRTLTALFEEFCVRLTNDKPLVLVLEDLHWADRTSLDLLETLLALVRRIPLCLVIVSRPATPGHPNRILNLAETRFADCHHAVALAPLNEGNSLEMVKQLLFINELPPDLAQLVLSKAEGNPFYVEEVIRSLIERGALMPAENGDGWVTTPLIETLSVPDTLQGVLMARLDRLPDEVKRVVQQAAVVGRIFLYRVLLYLSRSNQNIDLDLSYLEQQQLIRERSRHPEIEYIFKHSLTQEVAYQSLLNVRRKELHNRVGQAMEEIYADRQSEYLGIVGKHYFLGENWEKAAAFLTQAGDAAARLHANQEARCHYAEVLTALNNLPDTEAVRRQRVDTIVKQVSVSFSISETEPLLEMLALAEKIMHYIPTSEPQDRHRQAWVFYWTGRMLYTTNRLRDALGYFEKVLHIGQELEDLELLAIPSVMIGRVRVVRGQFADAINLLLQAADPLAKAENWTNWATALGFSGVALAACGKYNEGIRQTEKALAHVREINNDSLLGLIQLLHTATHFMGGNLDGTLQSAKAVIDITSVTGDRLYRYSGYAFTAWCEAKQGFAESARRNMNESQVIQHSLGEQLVLADWFAALDAEIALLAGEYDRSIELAQKAIEMAQSVGGVFAEVRARRSWGLALLNLHDENEARNQLELSLEIAQKAEMTLECARTKIAIAGLSTDLVLSYRYYQWAAEQFDRAGLPLPPEIPGGYLNPTTHAV